MAQKRNHLMRYVILAVTFCVVCLVYVGRMFYVQIITKEETKEDGTSVRLVIVPAVRGEIFDRNGKALVANRYTYDLVLSNAALSAVSANEVNDSAATRGLPYRRAAEAVGLIGLKFNEPT